MAKKIITDRNGLKGLILAGGKSSRLGLDKAFLQISGEPQVNFMHKQFTKAGIDTFISVTKESKNKFRGLNLIIDEGNLEGPLAGIHAALKKELCPWLVVAVDMPFINSSALNFLISKREPTYDATSYTMDGDKPEPMFTIWEASCHKKIESFINIGGTSPIQFLQKNKTKLVPLPDSNWIKNINTELDLQQVKKDLRSMNS